MVWTVGHSTRSIEDLVALLRAHRIATVADVRRYPASRRHPQFTREALAGALAAAGLGYVHLEGLGGRRATRPDSVNRGWRDAGFRGYADHMQTEAFDMHLRALLEEAHRAPTAILCAEAVPWRCHRRLIADALVARGVEVRHIVGAGPAEAHALTPFARVAGGRVTYPGEPELFTTS
ncbi:MAG TPA: DUF488 domain-containing protein [Candidatus Tectomicrobia bacterium]|nr:DUF488 domain-containing protein [Candidatus Tectomicrobia bacterium]